MVLPRCCHSPIHSSNKHNIAHVNHNSAVPALPRKPRKQNMTYKLQRKNQQHQNDDMEAMFSLLSAPKPSMPQSSSSSPGTTSSKTTNRRHPLLTGVTALFGLGLGMAAVALPLYGIYIFASMFDDDDPLGLASLIFIFSLILIFAYCKSKKYESMFKKILYLASLFLVSVVVCVSVYLSPFVMAFILVVGFIIIISKCREIMRVNQESKLKLVTSLSVLNTTENNYETSYVCMTYASGHIKVWKQRCLVGHNADQEDFGWEEVFCKQINKQGGGATRACIFFQYNRQATQLMKNNHTTTGSTTKTTKTWSIALASDEGRIVVCSQDGILQHEVPYAHNDYIRSLEEHPSLPFLLSASDDMTIRLWDCSESSNWKIKRTYHGHANYVMEVKVNPRNTNQFASASLDGFINFWSIESTIPLFSLDHERGVNCIAFYPSMPSTMCGGGGRPLHQSLPPPLLAAGDLNGFIKIWNYESLQLIHTLTAHAKPVTRLMFFKSSPPTINSVARSTSNHIAPTISNMSLVSTSEDSFVRIWDAEHDFQCLVGDGGRGQKIPGRGWALADGIRTNHFLVGHDLGCQSLTLYFHDNGGDLECVHNVHETSLRPPKNR